MITTSTQIKHWIITMILSFLSVISYSQEIDVFKELVNCIEQNTQISIEKIEQGLIDNNIIDNNDSKSYMKLYIDFYSCRFNVEEEELISSIINAEYNASDIDSFNSCVAKYSVIKTSEEPTITKIQKHIDNLRTSNDDDDLIEYVQSPTEFFKKRLTPSLFNERYVRYLVYYLLKKEIEHDYLMPLKHLIAQNENRLCDNKTALLRSFNTSPTYRDEFKQIYKNLDKNILKLFNRNICCEKVKFNVPYQIELLESINLSFNYYHTCSSCIIHKPTFCQIFQNSKGQILFEDRNIHYHVENDIYNYYMKEIGLVPPDAFEKVNILLQWDSEVSALRFGTMINEIVSGYLTFAEDFSKTKFEKEICLLNDQEIHILYDLIPLNIYFQEPEKNMYTRNEPQIVLIDDETEATYVYEDTDAVEVDSDKYYEAEEAEIAYSKVDKMPIYPGCEKEIESEIPDCSRDKVNQYIKDNLRYPQYCIDENIQGTVYVYYEVGSNGKIQNIKIISGNPKFEDEALRLIRSLPDHKPGRNQGENVAVKYTIPVKFELK